MMLSAWNDWKLSNRIAWPMVGGRLEQPAWVIRYFDIFNAIEEVIDLEKKRADVKALPTREQALGRAAG